MTIESKLDALTAAINNLAAAYAGKQAAPIPNAPLQPTITAIPQPAPTPAPVAAPMPGFVMPGAPAAAAPAAPTVPFTDAKGLLGYVMSAYQAMGPAKGAGIQGVMQSIGVANVNDVTPDKYAAFYAGVEQLKQT